MSPWERAVWKVKEPLPVRERASPPLSSRTTVPERPERVPPTVYEAALAEAENEESSVVVNGQEPPETVQVMPALAQDPPGSLRKTVRVWPLYDVLTGIWMVMGWVAERACVASPNDRAPWEAYPEGIPDVDTVEVADSAVKSVVELAVMAVWAGMVTVDPFGRVTCIWSLKTTCVVELRVPELWVRNPGYRRNLPSVFQGAEALSPVFESLPVAGAI